MPTYIKVFLASILSKFLIFFLGKNKLTENDGVKFNLDLTEGIDLRVFLNFLEEKKLYSSLKKILDKRKKYYFIDIGANIGSVTLNLAKKFSKSTILSIEPTFYAYKKLKFNINLNKSLKKRIKILNIFISNTKKSKKYTYSSWKLNFNSQSHPIHKGVLKKTSSDQKTLDEIINKMKKVDFIKIDTDGHEYQILVSGLKQIKKNKPIIHMEFAPYLYKENGISSPKLINIIKKKLKYDFYDEDLVKIQNINNHIEKIGNSSKNFFIIPSKFAFKNQSR